MNDIENKSEKTYI